MLPQHDPLFMQAPADHEGRWKGKKKKNLPCAPRLNCNTLHGLHHLRNKSSAGNVFFLPDLKGVVIITVTHEAIWDC